jgi:hypothetical protein
MKLVRSAFVLLAICSLNLSLAVPREDVSETTYDESESLPSTMPPLLSCDPAQQSARAGENVPIVLCDSHAEFRHIGFLEELAGHPIHDSLVIVNFVLRC